MSNRAYQLHSQGILQAEEDKQAAVSAATRFVATYGANATLNTPLKTRDTSSPASVEDAIASDPATTNEKEKVADLMSKSEAFLSLVDEYECVVMRSSANGQAEPLRCSGRRILSSHPGATPP
jgi:hypothetical protein